MYLPYLDLGKPVHGGSSPPGGPPDKLPDGIVNYYVEHRHGLYTDPMLKTDIRLTDKKLFEIKDNTKIDGSFQSEDYFYAVLYLASC